MSTLNGARARGDEREPRLLEALREAIASGTKPMLVASYAPTINQDLCDPPLEHGTLRRLVAQVRDEVEEQRAADAKLELPAPPAGNDTPGQCSWLTQALACDPAKPIDGGEWQGVAGPDGHVKLHRAGGAPAIRFEPARQINTPARLIEALSWSLTSTDRPIPAYKANHCRAIAYVVRCLCGTERALTAEEQTAAIIGAFLQSAEKVEGCTIHGTPQQRYEAGVHLQRPVGASYGQPPLYLVDSESGEFVIRVGDLAAAARSHLGGSLRNGWLDARMQDLRWTRVEVDARSEPGRAGRRAGNHVRCAVYRGQLHSTDGSEGVTT